jgi:hypothetical protein
VSERSRRGFGVVCTAIAILFISVGMATLAAFFKPQWNNTPEKLPAVEQTTKVVN